MGHRLEESQRDPINGLAPIWEQGIYKEPGPEWVHRSNPLGTKMATRLHDGQGSDNEAYCTNRGPQRDCEEKRELAMAEQIAKDLAYDIVYYVSNLKKLRPSSKHASTLRRTVDELSERHKILFNGIVTKLEVTEDTGCEIFTNIANEMFRDGQFNWGRLATVYAFSGRLAKYFAEKNAVDYVDRIAEFTGDYVARVMAHWIHQQGGWDAFDDFFPEQGGLEGTLWRGLLYTMVGLGALATMAAVR